MLLFVHHILSIIILIPYFGYLSYRTWPTSASGFHLIQ